MIVDSYWIALVQYFSILCHKWALACTQNYLVKLPVLGLGLHSELPWSITAHCSSGAEGRSNYRKVHRILWPFISLYRILYYVTHMHINIYVYNISSLLFPWHALTKILCWIVHIKLEQKIKTIFPLTFIWLWIVVIYLFNQVYQN